MSRRLPLFASLLALVALFFTATSAPAQAVETPRKDGGRWVWLLTGVSFGFGSHRMGAMHGTATVEAHVWLFDDIGVGAQYGGVASGAPDGGGSEGSFAAGVISFRHPVVQRRHESAWFFASAGVGGAHLSGYDDSHNSPRARFDVGRILFTGRIGALTRWRFLAAGGGLDLQTMPTQGTSVAVSIFVGAVF